MMTMNHEMYMRKGRLIEHLSFYLFQTDGTQEKTDLVIESIFSFKKKQRIFHYTVF